MQLSPSSVRWILLVVLGVVLALLWWWIQRDEQETRPGKGIAKDVAAPAAAKVQAAAQPEPKPQPPAAPAQPKPALEPLTATVLFDFDRAVLRPAETAALDRLASQIKAAAFDRIEAVGHADRIGTSAYNLKLSERRAEAVKTYLLGRGMDPEGMRTQAKGESDAVTGDACKNMGPETRQNRKLVACLQPDRRVAIEVVGRR